MHSNLNLPDDVNSIVRYGLNLKCNKNISRKFIIELHDYKGFSLVKFYPHHLKKVPKKYELRGESIGYRLDRSNLLDLLYQCALVMKNYLENYPENFTGYVGQTDKLDSCRKKAYSQRSSVYNILTSSIFPTERYKLSAKQKFKDVNLRLIRKVVSKQNGKLTTHQFQNYQEFLTYFESRKGDLYDLMTPITKERVVNELSRSENTDTIEVPITIRKRS
ncbi:hypothetical protein [Fluviicola taffensis]|uniref:Uncharacterized protein n=1 Tax=Fluviicola taffensis (strain DSM 16823 / NCIMB 13979 / RW262) TaxID=755732 RepID=F2IE58_FLUTR|nr:hypothetical protein [Fluviicola taffensis]AEA42376.1 hypothetical protein Fluta_0368 [Fluviicola taffensis DSM 16823]